ncbi:MAG TPA: phosphoenolpyruvate carboxylase, partial [Bacillota bacterium]|nr:phosphoenolpyruvate carboxylase [Bacillota bacterium]
MTKIIDKNVSLRQDVKMLGNILGDILILHGGKELFDKVENIREMTKSIRTEFDEKTYQ